MEFPANVVRSTGCSPVDQTAHGLDDRVKQLSASNRLALQPRMGFSDIATMRAGLAAVKSQVEGSIGTITIDAYTRVGQVELARQALENGASLNGFPITAHPREAVREMLSGIVSANFPVQVRHGSAFPLHIFKAAAECGVTAIEGGPVSYNLPYSRASLSETVPAWREAADLWANAADDLAAPTHIETFGGCLLGQLCPPSLLIATSTLEALFFASRGVPGISLSLAQGTSFDQDVGALLAMGRIVERRLSWVNTHKVFYTFMGLFPTTPAGSEKLIRASARIAATGGAERLIVKTAAEAHGIPTIEENVAALAWARETADATEVGPTCEAWGWADVIEEEAERMIESVLRLSPDIGDALVGAFATGLLDVPYCMHPDNRGLTSATVDPETGALVWTRTGNLAIGSAAACDLKEEAAQFDRAIETLRRTYDAGHGETSAKETQA